MLFPPVSIPSLARFNSHSLPSPIGYCDSSCCQCRIIYLFIHLFIYQSTSTKIKEKHLTYYCFISSHLLLLFIDSMTHAINILHNECGSI